MSMDTLISIRAALGMRQADLAGKLGISQAMVSYYEKADGPMPPALAKKLITAANEAGLPIAWAHIYDDAPLPAQAGMESSP